jgi:predicted DNA-binding protein (MmcQ/YjbR family)
MTIEEIQQIADELDQVVVDLKWQSDLCFNIGGKMFFVIAPDKIPVSVSFKTDEETYYRLLEKDGFFPAPYLARYFWVLVDDINRLTKKEWKVYMQTAYEMVKSKQTKTIKKRV